MYSEYVEFSGDENTSIFFLFLEAPASCKESRRFLASDAKS